MSANPIIEVWGGTGSDYKTAFGTFESATTAKVGDYVQVSGLAPYDGTWRLSKVWRAGAGSPPKMVYAIVEDLFTHFGTPEGWPAHNRAPYHNPSALTIFGASSSNAVSGPQKMYIPAGALVAWEACTAGRSAQSFTLRDASGQVVATASGSSPDGTHRDVASGQFRASGEPFYTLAFDLAARILPSADPLLWERRLYLQTHKLMTDRAPQDRGFRDLMVELKVFANQG